MATATYTRDASGGAPVRHSVPNRGSAFTGVGTLIRFILRRDRIKLPAWVLGITLMGFYYAVALPQVYKTPEDLQAISQFGGGVVGALVSGPGYGLVEPTVESVIVAVYGLYFLILAALMNILLVSRHTRAEEQAGRSELVRASVVGRRAQLTATLAVAIAANVALALLIAATIVGAGLDSTDALLFGGSVGAAGLAFAAITAVTVQLTEYSRAAAGLAGAALGAAYVIRAAGDMITPGGSALSWFSPLAWSQQTRAYADGRWWPLALSVGFAVVAAAVGYALSVRRDDGAGLIAARRGNLEAASWLNSPMALAFRLQRASLLGWAFALAAAAGIFGAVARPIVDAFADLPDQVVDVMGGDPSRMLDGYLGTMGLVDALLVGVFVILGVQALRTEETKGRGEPVLATAVSRPTWFGSYLTVLAAGAVVLLLVAGLVLGAATAVSVGDATYVWDVTVAHLVYAPAVLVVLAVAAVLFGFLPKAVGATWALLGFAMFIGFFGSLMNLPQWINNISPFEHIARLPLAALTAPPLIVLPVIAAALAALGVYGFTTRDIEGN